MKIQKLNTIPYLAILFVALTLTLTSISWVYGYYWDSDKYNLEEKTKGKYYTKANIKYNNTLNLHVFYKDKLTSEAQELIKESVELFYNNKFVVFDKMTFFYRDGNVSFLMNPKTTVDKTKQVLIPHIATGMKFYYTDVLSYDFRIFTKASNYIRLQGSYWNMEDMLKKIEETVNTSTIYYKDISPRYLANQLQYIYLELEALKKDVRKTTK